MNNVHGDIDKLLSSGAVVQGLLNSNIHDSIQNSINDANFDLSDVSSKHDNCLDLDGFFYLLNDAQKVYKDLLNLTNNIHSSTYTLQNTCWHRICRFGKQIEILNCFLIFP